MARKHRLSKAATAAAGYAAGKAAQKTRSAWHELTHPHKCSGCGQEFRYLRAHKAHAAAHHMGRWSSAAARKAARGMGKAQDAARRHAMGWLEAAGLREWRKVPVRDKDGNARTRKDGTPITRDVPVRTGRDRSRPQLRGRVTRAQLRDAHRHDRGHERADGHDGHAARHTAHAGTLSGRAKEHAAAGNRIRAALGKGRAALHEGRAALHTERASTRRERADTLRARSGR